MADKNGLPKKVFVFRNKDGDFEWLDANESLEDCAVKDETRVVGVYELKETKSITLKVTEEVIEE